MNLGGDQTRAEAALVAINALVILVGIFLRGYAIALTWNFFIASILHVQAISWVEGMGFAIFWFAVAPPPIRPYGVYKTGTTLAMLKEDMRRVALGPLYVIVIALTWHIIAE